MCSLRDLFIYLMWEISEGGENSNGFVVAVLPLTVVFMSQYYIESGDIDLGEHEISERGLMIPDKPAYGEIDNKIGVLSSSDE